MKVEVEGTSSNQIHTQIVAQIVSTGANILTSEAEAYLVAETIQSRATGPKINPIRIVQISDLRSSSRGSAGTKVVTAIINAEIKTIKDLGISWWCRQMTILVLKVRIDRSAIKLPSSPPLPNDPQTIISIPVKAALIASHVRLDVSSLINNLAIRAEKIGAPAIIATTLATSVLVTA